MESKNCANCVGLCESAMCISACVDDDHSSIFIIIIITITRKEFRHFAGNKLNSVQQEDQRQELVMK